MFEITAVKKLIQNINKNRVELLELAVSGTGTPVKYHLDDLDYALSFIKDLPKIYTKFINNLDRQSLMAKPKGKLLMVLSANEPFIMSFVPVLSALVLGNQVLLKPAGVNQKFNQLLVKIYQDSGITGLTLVDIGRDDLAKFLDREQPEAAVWFGSSRVIKAVAPEFASRMIEFIPECEGNDLAYISSHAGDLNKAAKIVLHSLIRHQGQCCNAIKGILVAETIAEKFDEALLKESQKLQGGELMDLKSDFLASGQEPQIEEVNNDYKKDLQINPFTVKQWLTRVAGLETALKISHENPFGIGFTIFSDDPKECAQAEAEVTAARININRDPLKVSYTEPWGGTGLSGYGGARPWLDKFSNRTFLAGAHDQ